MVDIIQRWASNTEKEHVGRGSPGGIRNTSVNFDRLTKALYTHLPTSIFDQHGNISFANDRFVDLFAYPRDEVIGQNYRALFCDRKGPELMDKIRQISLSGRCWHGNIWCLRKDGSRFCFNVTAIPLFDAAGGKPEEYCTFGTVFSPHEEESRLLSIGAGAGP